MYRYIFLHSKHLQHHVTCAIPVMQRCAFAVKIGPEDSDTYNLTTFKFKYSSQEKEKILSTLNQCSEMELFRLRLTKSDARKLLRGRARQGTFHSLSQLLHIDGLGLKHIEHICEVLLRDIPREEEESKLLMRRIVKPTIAKEVMENLNTIVALEVTLSRLSWTLSTCGNISDFGSAALFTREDRLASPDMYNKIVSVVKNIPSADVYVWEEKVNVGRLQRASTGMILLALKLSQIRGMLTGILDCRKEGQEYGRLFYLRDSVVSKLFKLKVGGERISGLSIADDLMRSKQVLDWLDPLVLDTELRRKYFSMNELERRHLYISFFIGLAFYNTVINENEVAQEIIQGIQR